MITITPETQVKNCGSCGRIEVDKKHKDTGFKRISFRVGDNAGANIIILCPKCFSLLNAYTDTVLRQCDDTEIRKKTDFVAEEG